MAEGIQNLGLSQQLNVEETVASDSPILEKTRPILELAQFQAEDPIATRRIEVIGCEEGDQNIDFFRVEILEESPILETANQVLANESNSVKAIIIRAKKDLPSDLLRTAKKIIRFIGNLWVVKAAKKALRALARKIGDCVGRFFMPKATERDRLSELSHDHLPRTLTGIIHNVVDFLNMKRAFTRFPLLKQAYEGLSGLALKFVLKYGSGAIEVGVQNLAKVLEAQFAKTKEKKEEFIVKLEGNVSREAGLVLKNLNEAYHSLHEGYGNTHGVIQELKEKGQLHEAFAVLTEEEETLWKERECYLKPRETLFDAIARLEKEESGIDRIEFSQVSKIRTQIETLKQLKEIQVKISAQEYKYLGKLCHELFDEVLFPDGSFYQSLPIGLKPFAARLRELILLSLTATLSCGIDELSNPDHMYQRIIGLEGRSPIVSEGETFYDAEERQLDGVNPTELDEDIFYDAEEQLEEEERTVRRFNPASGEVLELSKEVARVGFPNLMEFGERVHFCASAAHSLAGYAFRAVDQALGAAERISYLSWIVRPAKQAVENAGHALENYDPTIMILDSVNRQMAGAHESLVNAFDENGMDAILELTEKLLSDASRPKLPFEKNVGKEAEDRAALKKEAKMVMEREMRVKLGDGIMFETAYSGAEQMLERFSDTRQNRLLIYAALDGLVQTLKEEHRG